MSIVLPRATIYDDITDVMFFKLGESRFTAEDEVLPGIHVLYEYDGETTSTVIAVEIEYFKERFENETTLYIPAINPFVLSLVN